MESGHLHIEAIKNVYPQLSPNYLNDLHVRDSIQLLNNVTEGTTKVRCLLLETSLLLNDFYEQLKASK